MRIVARLLTALLLPLLSTCTAAGQDPNLAHAQELMRQYKANKNSVSYAAGFAALRTDLDSRAKVGKVVEVTLGSDFRFGDGTLLPKGTVVTGMVTAAANHTRANPESSLVLDWTEARMGRKISLPVAAAVRDAQGGVPVQGADHTFGQNQLGATSNSGHAGDNNTTMNNSILMNKQAGMPQIAPGVTMEPAEGHSLRVTSQNKDIQLLEGTKMVLVLFKDRTPVAAAP